MTRDQKQQVVDSFTRALDRDPEVRVSFYRRMIEIEPEDCWKQFAPGPTTYVLLAVGPQETIERDLIELLDDWAAR